MRCSRRSTCSRRSASISSAIVSSRTASATIRSSASRGWSVSHAAAFPAPPARPWRHGWRRLQRRHDAADLAYLQRTVGAQPAEFIRLVDCLDDPEAFADRARELGLSEAAAERAGGGLLQLVIVLVAALALSGCKDRPRPCGNSHPAEAGGSRGLARQQESLPGRAGPPRAVPRPCVRARLLALWLNVGSGRGDRAPGAVRRRGPRRWRRRRARARPPGSSPPARLRPRNVKPTWSQAGGASAGVRQEFLDALGLAAGDATGRERPPALLDADVVGGKAGAGQEPEGGQGEHRARMPAPAGDAERDQRHVRPALPDAQGAGRQAADVLERKHAEQDGGARERKQQTGARRFGGWRASMGGP